MKLSITDKEANLLKKYIKKDLKEDNLQLFIKLDKVQEADTIALTSHEQSTIKKINL